MGHKAYATHFKPPHAPTTDQALANHVQKPVISADYSGQSVALTQAVRRPAYSRSTQSPYAVALDPRREAARRTTDTLLRL